MKDNVIIRKKLTASEGKYLTDGEIYAKDVYPASSADESIWREITETEYQSLMAERVDCEV